MGVIMAHWSNELRIDPVVWATALFGVITAAILVTRFRTFAAAVVHLRCAYRHHPQPPHPGGFFVGVSDNKARLPSPLSAILPDGDGPS